MAVSIRINLRKVNGTPVLKRIRMPADATVENYADGLATGKTAEVFEIPAESMRALLAYAAEQSHALNP